MAKKRHQDPEFEIGFFETVLRRSPRDATVIEILASLYTRQGRLTDGLRMDRRLVRLQPENATAHYNLACSLALTKRNRAALHALQQAVQLGYSDFDWMQQDPDLDSLKHWPEFLRLLDQVKPQS
jgi:predicted Zn-dependent protease